MAVQNDVNNLERNTSEDRTLLRSSLARQRVIVKVLIGDRIRQQSQHPLLISLSELDALIAQLASGAKHGRLRILIGQGAAPAAIAAAHERIRAAGLNEIITLEAPPGPASAELTHKHKSANCLITEPFALGDGKYAAMLQVDERCAEMDDHLTGVHLQGMLVIEAARQMLLAVTEKYYLRPQDRGQCRFSTEKLEISYFEFLFPLPTTIRFEQRLVRRLGPRNFIAIAGVVLEQGGRRVAAANIRFSVLEKAFVVRREQAALDERVAMIADQSTAAVRAAIHQQ